jgi:apolipoprotein N-acyltransferase
MPTWNNNLTTRAALGFSVLAVMSFHLAYLVPNCGILFVLFFYCLFHLANVPTCLKAFYIGLAIGLAIYAPQLSFFWNLFKIAAIPLWAVLSLWLSLFLLLGRACLARFGLVGWACAAPFVWLGLEYFRSELYYLRFSWSNAGYAFSNSYALHYAACYGVYGIGFVLMAIAVLLVVFTTFAWRAKIFAATAAVILLLYPALAPAPQNTNRGFQVTGIQLEFPSVSETRFALDQAIAKFPDTDLFVLSEYAFTGPVPPLIRKWCVKHHKYLVAGGEDIISSSQYYNTAFVLDPQGEIIFKQGKCIPIQFFKDGLPAPAQTLWSSPWGKLGLGICYDASYTRVTDELVRQGAQGLIFPTMDVQDWGNHQHQLHSRIAPMRAAEYALPVFRLCSSGISQYADSGGRVLNSAPFPGEGATMNAQMQLVSRGRMPPDRLPALLSAAFALALSVYLAVNRFCHRSKNLPIPAK